MKSINANKVATEVAKCGKKLKVGEVVGLLVQSINGVEKHQNTQFRDEDVNKILTYFSLSLLARVNTKADYEKILNDCSIEVKEAQA